MKQVGNFRLRDLNLAGSVLELYAHYFHATLLLNPRLSANSRVFVTTSYLDITAPEKPATF